MDVRRRTSITKLFISKEHVYSDHTRNCCSEHAESNIFTHIGRMLGRRSRSGIDIDRMLDCKCPCWSIQRRPHVPCSQRTESRPTPSPQGTFLIMRPCVQGCGTRQGVVRESLGVIVYTAQNHATEGEPFTALESGKGTSTPPINTIMYLKTTHAMRL